MSANWREGIYKDNPICQINSGKYKGLNICVLYEEQFEESVPFYDMAAEHKTDDEWTEIIINALEEGKPYEVDIPTDPDTLY